MNLSNPNTRAQIYKLAAAVFAVLVLHGLLTAEQAAAYGEVILQVLGVAALLLAGANTPTESEADEETEDGEYGPETAATLREQLAADGWMSLDEPARATANGASRMS